MDTTLVMETVKIGDTSTGIHLHIEDDEKTLGELRRSFCGKRLHNLKDQTIMVDSAPEPRKRTLPDGKIWRGRITELSVEWGGEKRSVCDLCVLGFKARRYREKLAKEREHLAS
jgi:hypothetical protein